MDGRPGIFPRYPAGPTTSLPAEKRIRQFEGYSTFDLHGHPGYVEALPIAAGQTLLMAPEDPERFVRIRSLSGELQLLDGRNLAQNGWFVVRTLWVFTDSSPFSNYSGIGALAAASRALQGFNDSLAAECLALAKKAYAEERARPAPAAPPSGFGARFGQLAEPTAVMQLATATKEQPYAARFDELVWPARDRNAAMTLQLAARAIPVMDSGARTST